MSTYLASHDAPVEVAAHLADLLPLTFELHDSSFWGGDYFKGSGEGFTDAMVHLNRVDDEGPLLESDPEYQTLVRLEHSVDFSVLSDSDALADHGIVITQSW